MRKVAIALPLLVVAGLVWSYLPPIGKTLELPDIEPLLEPGVPHDKPEFIDTGKNVFYRVRLTQLVPWDFSRDYLETLRRRGVQFTASVHRPFGPGARLEGWEAALAWEKSVSPYIIGYRKSSDRRTPSFPAKLRWPWLYLRFGRDLLEPRTARLLPDAGTAILSHAIPRYPGSVLTQTARTDQIVHLVFVAPATEAEVLNYYKGAFEATFKSQATAWNHYVETTPTSGDAWIALGRPERVQVEVDTMLYTDHPLVVFSREAADRIPEKSDPHQPASLEHLPPLTRYQLRLRYDGPENAQHAIKTLVIPSGG